MYCQKCFKKLPDDKHLCPLCHYNNSPFLTQPNILFGIYKDSVPEFVEMSSSNSFVSRFRRKKGVSGI